MSGRHLDHFDLLPDEAVQHEQEHERSCGLRTRGICDCGLWPNEFNAAVEGADFEPLEKAVEHPGTCWVVRAINQSTGRREWSVSPQFVLFQLTSRSRDAWRFDRFEDASAHATHLSFIYRLPFEVVARVRA